MTPSSASDVEVDFRPRPRDWLDAGPSRLPGRGVRRRPGAPGRGRGPAGHARPRRRVPASGPPADPEVTATLRVRRRGARHASSARTSCWSRSARAGSASSSWPSSSDPVRRKVALKVLKPGMDTRQVVARFEAERQALALMDHPNIAKVLDAGSTDDRPPVLRDGAGPRACRSPSSATRTTCPSASGWSCSSHVCQAVQHAHQKGVIHRDLKPSNVLVTLHDGGAGGQGDRLRHRQGDRPAADRARRCSPASPRWSARRCT